MIDLELAHDSAPDWRVPLWEAIHRYVVACWGDPAQHVYGNATRQAAVVEVERTVSQTIGAPFRKRGRPPAKHQFDIDRPWLEPGAIVSCTLWPDRLFVVERVGYGSINGYMAHLRHHGGPRSGARTSVAAALCRPTQAPYVCQARKDHRCELAGRVCAHCGWSRP